MSESPQPGPQAPPGPPGPPGPPAPPRGSGGRYQRSTNGLVGALLVTLLVIGAFVAFRAINGDDVSVSPEKVDYLAVVDAAQQGGYDVVYPAHLPRGWIADSVHVTPGNRPPWDVGMLTDDGRFVGMRQEDAPLDDLLTKYVDKNPTEGAKVHLDSKVASTWRSFSDSGGDHAYAAEVGGDVVLVYGSASTDDLRTVVGELTTAQR